MIKLIHLIFFAVFLAFAFYIDVVIVIVDIIVGVIIVTIDISKDRFVVDFYKKELYFVICKRLESFEDCDIIYCLASVCHIEIQLDIGFLDPFKQDDLYKFIYNI